MTTHPAPPSPRLLLAVLILLGPMARADVKLTPSAPCVVPGREVHFTAERDDDRVPDWAWTLVDPAPEGRFALLPAAEGKGRAHFLAFEGAGPEAGVRVRVTDRNAAGVRASAEAWVPVVPAMLELLAPAELPSGATCEVRVRRADGGTGLDRWRLLEDRSGELLGAGLGLARYHAPRVAVPSTFHVQVTTLDGYRALAAIRVRPRIVAREAVPSVVAGNLCRLAFARTDALAPAWGYRILDSPAGVAAGADGSAWFRAPLVDVPITVTLQVRDLNHPEDCLEVPIQVEPRVMPSQGMSAHDDYDLLFQKLLPRVLGHGLAPVPGASLLAGHLERPGAQEGEPVFRDLAAVRFLEADAGMGQWNRTWLVGDDGGVHSVTARGEVTTLAATEGAVTALAVRPPGSLPGRPQRVLFGTFASEDGAFSQVRELAADLGVRVLAGAALGERADVDGAAATATFGTLVGLAARADGTVFVAEEYRLRSIAPDGRVSTVARVNAEGLSFPYLAGAGGPIQEIRLPLQAGLPALNEATFAGRTFTEQLAPRCYGLALDPATEDLYLSHTYGIHKLARDWKVSEVVGWKGQAWNCLPPYQPQACSWMGATGLTLHGRALYFADPGRHAIQGFYLDTATLFTLAGNADQQGTRMGPLGRFSPALSPGDCAALETPSAVAFNAEGTCLVGLRHGLVHLELGAFTAPADLGEGAATQPLDEPME